MINLPTLRQLRHLVALARHEHFGRAAQACNVTQSTLSASIKELEALLQATLVDRTRRRVVVTPLGQSLVERAEEVLREAEDLVEADRVSREPLTGHLNLGEQLGRPSCGKGCVRKCECRWSLCTYIKT